jgi:elongation factor Ts
MAVSAAQIKELRDSTGAGMMDCKKALMESDGDIQAASDWLRKKGLAAAAKKSGRVAAEGLVGVATADKAGAIVELNSETDFVARNEQFQELVSNIASVALREKGDLDAIQNSAYPKGGTVSEAITEAIGTIGENMTLRRTAYLEAENGFVASYIHNAIGNGLGKIGVLVALNTTDPDNEQIQQLGKQIAMHVAAARPDALTRDQVNSEKIERERQVLKEQAIASGKPAEIAEKMVEGRLRKFYEEIVLPEQLFVIDGKTKVSEAVQQTEKETGASIQIAGFISYQLGEGVEKEEDDFAAEVAAAAGVA